jgi:hypothetical protein
LILFFSPSTIPLRALKKSTAFGPRFFLRIQLRTAF